MYYTCIYMYKTHKHLGVSVIISQAKHKWCIEWTAPSIPPSNPQNSWSALYILYIYTCGYDHHLTNYNILYENLMNFKWIIIHQGICLMLCNKGQICT